MSSGVDGCIAKGHVCVIAKASTVDRWLHCGIVSGCEGQRRTGRSGAFRTDCRGRRSGEADGVKIDGQKVTFAFWLEVQWWRLRGQYMTTASPDDLLPKAHGAALVKPRRSTHVKR